MKLLILLFLTTIGTNAFAGIEFICNTKVSEGYYVKSTIKLKVDKADSVFVTPYDATADGWNSGSVGTLSSVKKDGTSVFKGFSSEDMFGDLSEGAADRGIYLYVSTQVMSGKDGWVSLFASGTEVGIEKARYDCRLNP